MPGVVYYRKQESTIADTGNLGAEVWDVEDGIVCGVILDSAWDSADHLGFKVCATETGTYVPLYDSSGSLVSIDADASRAYALDPQDFGPWRFIKPWSQDGSGSNAAQDGATTLTLVSK